MRNLFFTFSIFILLLISCNRNKEEIITMNNNCYISISDTSVYNFIYDYIKFKKQKKLDFFKDNVVFVDVYNIPEGINLYIENSFKFNIYSKWISHIDSSQIKYYQQSKIENVNIYFNSGLDSYLDIKYESEKTYPKIVTYGIDPDLYVLTIKYGDKNIVTRSKFLNEQKYDSLKKVDSIMYRDIPLFMKENDSAIVSSRKIKR